MDLEEQEAILEEEELALANQTPAIYLDLAVESALDRIPFEYPDKPLPHEERHRTGRITRHRARLNTVLAVFFEVMKGKDITTIQWTSPFKLYDFFLQQVDRFEDEIRESRLLEPTDPEVLDIHFANLHSNAVYGNLVMWSYIVQGVPIDEPSYKARVRAALKWKSEADGDIVDFYNDEGHYIPTFYVAVDHKWKKIVLAIRGTLTLNDALIDVVNVPVPFMDGHTHTGVAYSVRCIAEMTLPTIRTLEGKYPGYDVVFSGHSLGGAVCVVLHSMWRGTVVPKLRTWTFGAPPCVSQPLADKCEGVVQTVHEFDNLPRTSMECIDSLIALLKDVDNTLKTRAKPDSKRFYKLAGTIIQVWKKRMYVIRNPSAMTEMFFHVRGLLDHTYPNTLVPEFPTQALLSPPALRIEDCPLPVDMETLPPQPDLAQAVS
jgi:hypothetical protein